VRGIVTSTTFIAVFAALLEASIESLARVQLHDLALQRDVKKANSAKFRGALHAKPVACDRISRPEAALRAR
jgi:hypothetical protein